MQAARLHLLLILWCLLVAVPGVLVTLGAFGPFRGGTEAGGGIVGFWIAGYLAQIAIFVWITRIVDKQILLWWLAASLLPWGFDWILPVHPVYGSFLFLVLIAIAVWIGAVAGRDEWLRQHGVRAVGVVLEVLKPWMNVVINNVYIKRKVRVRIERRDGVPPYEGLYHGLFMIGDLPSRGDRLPLLVDPKNPKRFAYDKEGSEAYAASDGSWATASPEEPPLVKELEKLSELHQRGELTDAEFTAAKKKLLGYKDL
jgi:hypothetical protein